MRLGFITKTYKTNFFFLPSSLIPGLKMKKIIIFCLFFFLAWQCDFFSIGNCKIFKGFEFECNYIRGRRKGRERTGKNLKGRSLLGATCFKKKKKVHSLKFPPGHLLPIVIYVSVKNTFLFLTTKGSY